jgi:DNA-binding SARP family transcriptional activator
VSLSTESQGSSSRTWVVELLGRFNARAGRRVFESLPGGRTRDLLAYLLLFRDRPHHREVLAGTLWPETCTAQSRKYLRQSLWHLRALETTECGAVALITADTEWVQVDVANLWLDVAQVEEAFETVKLLPGEQLHAEQAETLKTVLPLFKGELLEGCYQDWCIYERGRLNAICVSLLEKLLGYCETQGDFEEGVFYGEELLRRDRAHERAHSRLMKLRYLAGDRSGALRQFGRCREALKEELGVDPGDRTWALYEQIRSDEIVQASKAIVAQLSPAPSACPSVERRYLCPGHARAMQGTSITEPMVVASLEKALEALSRAACLLEQGIRAVQHPSR